MNFHQQMPCFPGGCASPCHCPPSVPCPPFCPAPSQGPTGPVGPTGPTGPTGPSNLLNLVDGNAPGSVRGIHTATDYTMGTDAIALGRRTRASGSYAFAQGDSSVASAAYAFAEGDQTNATGESSHAEGEFTTASGLVSHAEGFLTVASGQIAHAEGIATAASGEAAHAEGSSTTASGSSAHAEGTEAQAIGAFSHAQNSDTIAQNDYQTAMGRFNIASNPALNRTAGDDALIIGNGYSTARSNALRVLFNGNVYSASGVYTTGADYAEMFEWQDHNPSKEDRRGLFVTLEGEYIRKATSRDSYILGVVSSSPSVVGDAYGCYWQGMFLRDEWGSPQYEWADQPRKAMRLDPETRKPQAQTQAIRHLQPKLDPQYDPNRPYLPRTERGEWAAVALIGKVIVRDDGSCRANGYCMPNLQGVATASERGYRVLKRLSANKALICLKGM